MRTTPNAHRGRRAASRVDGRDIEPGAEARTDYALSCRVYRTDTGASGQPDERWLRDALRNTRH